MSVSVLLQPESKNFNYLHLYANQVETKTLVAEDATIDNVTINTIDVDDLNVTNLTVAGDAIISGVNFATIGGFGLNGQVLTSGGDSSVSWQTNGPGTGDVNGPGLSVVGNLATWNNGVGTLLADGGINISNVMENPAVTDLDMNDNKVEFISRVGMLEQALVALPPANNHYQYADSGDNKVHIINSGGSDGFVVLNPRDVDQPLLTTSSVQFSDFETTGGSVTLGGAVVSQVNFIVAGPPNDKYIQVGGGNFDIKNSAFSSILSMDDSLNSEFFGDVKVDGTLNPGSNWARLPVSDIIWRQSAVSSKNVLGSWAEVVFYANANEQAVNIYVDDSLNPCIMTSNYDCKGRTTFYPYTQSIGAVPALKFAVDVQLTDPTFKGVLQIVGLTNASSNIILSNGYLMAMFQGGLLSNDPASLLPIIDISPGNGNVIACYLGSTINTNNAVSIINVNVGSTLILAQENMSQPLGNNVISSTDGTAQLILQYDASFTNPWTNVGYTGVTATQLIDKAIGVSYDDSLVTPPSLGVFNVQDAIDVLKSRSSIDFHFGGTILLIATRLTYNGISTSGGLADTYVVMNRALSYYDGTIINLVFDTTSGDNTSEFDVYVNNASTGTFLLTGASGILSLNIPIVQNDYVQLRFTGVGTSPGASNFDLILQQ